MSRSEVENFDTRENSFFREIPPATRATKYSILYNGCSYAVSHASPPLPRLPLAYRLSTTPLVEIYNSPQPSSALGIQDSDQVQATLITTN